MKEITANKEMIAYCGLYCGSCKKYLKGNCPGCKENEKASWCKVRKCCMENNYSSCADCKEYEDIMKCKMYNNFMAKIFSFIFRSDREACIKMIKEKGYDEFAREMTEKKIVTFKK